MGPRLRKLALTGHVASSVGWLGAVAAFLALAVAGLIGTDGPTTRAAYLAMEPIALFVVVPLALASLFSGIVQALGTPWGLFRHYWVLIKLVVTVVATAVLLLQVGPIGRLADAARETTLSGPELREERASLVVHAGGGLLVLLVPTALSVYKPRGMTGYGLRKKRHEKQEVP